MIAQREATTPVGNYLVGLIGEGIQRSLSPAMHVAEATRLGVRYEYRILEQARSDGRPVDLRAVVESARFEGFNALNITHPFKQAVLPLLDELAEDARDVDAVNLIVFDGATARGHNTDWTGFLSAMRTGLPAVRMNRVVQVGTGGAGSATAYALLRLGVAHLQLIDLDLQRARLLAARYRSMFPSQRIEVLEGESDRSLTDADGVVQATPVGMQAHPGLSFNPSSLDANAWIAEVVYRPLETELVRWARGQGRAVLDGGRMAVGQAADSLRLITGLEPDTDRMRAHFLALVDGERSEGNAA